MEIDEVELKENYVDNRLKRFFSRGELDINRSKCHEIIRVRDTLDLSESEDEMESEGEESNLLNTIEVAF